MCTAWRYAPRIQRHIAVVEKRASTLVRSSGFVATDGLAAGKHSGCFLAAGGREPETSQPADDGVLSPIPAVDSSQACDVYLTVLSLNT